MQQEDRDESHDSATKVVLLVLTSTKKSMRLFRRVIVQLQLQLQLQLRLCAVITTYLYHLLYYAVLG